MVNQMPTIAKPTGRVAYSPPGGEYTMSLILAPGCITHCPVDTHCPGVALPVLCIQTVVTYTHYQNDMCGTHFAGALVTLLPLTYCLGLIMPFSSLGPHFTSPQLLFIGCCTLPYMVDFEMWPHITIWSSLRIRCLQLHLLRHYCILQV